MQPLAVVDFGLKVATSARVCVLPGYSFAVHKPSISSLHYFKTQICTVHANTRQDKERTDFREKLCTHMDTFLFLPTLIMM